VLRSMLRPELTANSESTVVPNYIADTAATLAASITLSSMRLAASIGLRLVRQPETGQRHAGEADAEFLQRSSARYGLGQSLGQFIEFLVHNFPFVLVAFVTHTVCPQITRGENLCF